MKTIQCPKCNSENVIAIQRGETTYKIQLKDSNSDKPEIVYSQNYGFEPEIYDDEFYFCCDCQYQSFDFDEFISEKETVII